MSRRTKVVYVRNGILHGNKNNNKLFIHNVDRTPDPYERSKASNISHYITSFIRIV